ncbi:MAG: hypothetical protein ABIZ64_08765 [Casimicrobium sp.]
MNASQLTLGPSISRWLAVLFSLCVAAQVIAVPGDLDTTFDTDGIVTFIPPGSAQQTTEGRTVLTADQKIVVASVCLQGGVTGFCLTRFNANGSVDSTFGTSGVAFGPAGSEKNIRGVTGLDIDPNTQALVIAGICRPAPNANDNFCVTRFSAAGVHETNFGSYAPFVTAIGNIKVGRLRVGSDSKVKLALGMPRSTPAGGSDMAILALNADGTPDATFVNSSTAEGLVGVKVLAAPSGATGKQYLVDLSIRPDGSTVYLGPCQINAGGTYYFVCMGALNPAGATLLANRTFISNYDDYPAQLMPLPDGSFIVAGTSTRAPPEAYGEAMISSRFKLNFANLTVGVFWGYVGAYYATGSPVAPTLFGSVQAHNFVASNDGKFYFQYCYGSDGASCTTKRVERFTSLGVPDTSWGTNGVFTIPQSQSTYRMGNLLVQDDGKLVAAGGSPFSSGFSLVRMTNDSMPGFACSMDIDGDGKVLPTTDGLLLSRALMGMTGNSVIQNATGVGATRATWAAIRDYLVLRCGLKLKP